MSVWHGTLPSTCLVSHFSNWSEVQVKQKQRWYHAYSCGQAGLAMCYRGTTLNGAIGGNQKAAPESLLLASLSGLQHFTVVAKQIEEFGFLACFQLAQFIRYLLLPLIPDRGWEGLRHLCLCWHGLCAASGEVSPAFLCEGSSAALAGAVLHVPLSLHVANSLKAFNTAQILLFPSLALGKYKTGRLNSPVCLMLLSVLWA